MDPQMLTLEGRFVRLEPLSQAHAASFLIAGAEWNLTAEFVRMSIDAALRKRDDGTVIPFATVDKASGQVAGGTAFLQIDPGNRRLEIGSTWLGQPWRRTALNTEAKLLMLRHAFETVGCVRVEFKPDAENERRLALRRIGASEEPTLLEQRVQPDGRVCQVVVYRLIDSEWPAIKVHLHELLAR